MSSETSQSETKYIIKQGDLLLANEDFKCHQCNCTTFTAKGLASQMFKKYPGANVYAIKHKIAPSIPGTVDVFPEGVINLYGQYSPGKASMKTKKESTMQRRDWFQQCLNDMLEKVPSGSTFAFPLGIGCGLAGGDWKEYEKILQEFSQNPRVKQVCVYQKLIKK